MKSLATPHCLLFLLVPFVSSYPEGECPSADPYAIPLLMFLLLSSGAPSEACSNSQKPNHESFQGIQWSAAAANSNSRVVPFEISTDFSPNEVFVVPPAEESRSRANDQKITLRISGKTDEDSFRGFLISARKSRSSRSLVNATLLRGEWTPLGDAASRAQVLDCQSSARMMTHTSNDPKKELLLQFTPDIDDLIRFSSSSSSAIFITFL